MNEKQENEKDEILRRKLGMSFPLSYYKKQEKDMTLPISQGNKALILIIIAVVLFLNSQLDFLSFPIFFILLWILFMVGFLAIVDKSNDSGGMYC